MQTGLGPSLRGVGALAADFYLRTGYMPLRADRRAAAPRRALLLGAARSTRSSRTSPRSGTGPPIPTPHPERGDLSAGQQLFTEHCAGCHQIVAAGGYVTGARAAAARATRRRRQIAEAVRIGPYVMPRFSTKAISDRQLDSIIRYVDYTKHPDDRGGWAIGHLGPSPEGLVTWFLAAAALVAFCMVIGKRLRRELGRRTG